MTLLITMFPFYLIGNVHCLGMCGPLAMCIGTSPYRIFYLLGRLLSFTLAGGVAGALGEVIGVVLANYRLSGMFSLIFGFVMAIVGLFYLAGFEGKIPLKAASKMDLIDKKLYQLLMNREPFPLFLFGFLTIALPCGQTLFVYSACALSGSTYTGIMNGFAFAALTSPALFLAMQARHILMRMKNWYRPVIGLTTLTVGSLMALRGLAEFGIISHLSVHPFVVY